MPHHASIALSRKTDFMIPSGIRLDLYSTTLNLPGDVIIPLLRLSKIVIEQDSGDEVIIRPGYSLSIEGRLSEGFKPWWLNLMDLLMKCGLSHCNQHYFYNRKVRVASIPLTNVSSRIATCSASFPIVLWLSQGCCRERWNTSESTPRSIEILSVGIWRHAK